MLLQWILTALIINTLACIIMAEEEFKCPKVGQFPDPYNCQKFYICTKWWPPYHSSCADGFLFNPKEAQNPIRNCATPDKVDCQPLVKITTTPAPILERTECPSAFHLVGQQCIQESREKVSWKIAKEGCSNLENTVDGSWKYQLLVAETPEMAEKLMELISAAGIELNEFNNFWLGASRPNKVGSFSWVSGTQVESSFPWGINHLGVQQPSSGTNQHCMALKYFRRLEGYAYANNKCRNKYKYLCEAIK